MCCVVGWFSGLYSKLQTAWVCAVLSRSIQFARDIVNILLTSFLRPYCKLQHLVFSTLIRGVAPEPYIEMEKKHGTVSTLQSSPQTPLARGIYPTVVKITTRLWNTRPHSETQGRAPSCLTSFLLASAFMLNLAHLAWQYIKEWK